LPTFFSYKIYEILQILYLLHASSLEGGLQACNKYAFYGILSSQELNKRFVFFFLKNLVNYLYCLFVLRELCEHWIDNYS
jgi:hypothetical protein